MKDMREVEQASEWLPEYVRGKAPDEAQVERLLAEDSGAREEVEILRALAEAGVEPMSRAEREYVFEEFRRSRRVSGTWLSAAWKIAAAIALLLTGVGVWQIATVSVNGEWDPTLAIEGWQADLEDLQPAATDVILALGYDVEPVVPWAPWDEAGSLDPDELVGPWEVER